MQIVGPLCKIALLAARNAVVVRVPDLVLEPVDPPRLLFLGAFPAEKTRLFVELAPLILGQVVLNPANC